ncbi:phospholipid scramblase 2-like, partial [Brachionus plicatilis]
MDYQQTNFNTISIPMNNMRSEAPLLPEQTVWMQKPHPVPGCPPGLDYLLPISKIHAEQLVSLTEAFVGWDTNNKYVLRNSSGMQIFYAFE